MKRKAKIYSIDELFEENEKLKLEESRKLKSGKLSMKERKEIFLQRVAVYAEYKSQRKNSVPIVEYKYIKKIANQIFI
jgi:hypothetical protein